MYFFFISYLQIILIFCVCPQLVEKTKYTDTSIKLLLTLRGLSGCIRKLIARKSPKKILKKQKQYNNNDNNNNNN